MLLESTEARIGMDVIDITDCPNKPPLKGLDLSNLSFWMNEKGEVIMDGNVTFLVEHGAPWSWIMHTQRLERGTWATGIVRKSVPDFCKSCHNPLELWSGLMKYVKIQKCPVPAGHVESFDRVNLGSFGVSVPTALIGEWNLFIETTLGKNYHDCFMVEGSVLEI
ncbi:uncharacterized protein LOC129758146 [Uranotaenia lowii]|uniref:uncharacterized protein LOC129758146 n=1 Tax=Uranotaenia lowii TaxID=190385 RepID=UPI00247B05A7|nr:uncharacterized protein LOC129758146 [Uranotaenia lowii]